MDDVVGVGRLGQVVERPEVAWAGSPVSACKRGAWGQGRGEGWVRTSNICDAEDSDGAALDHTALVREEGCGSGNGDGLVRRGTVGQVALAVVARLRRHG